MINTQTAIDNIWPQARTLLVQVMQQQETGIRKQLDPRGTAYQLYDLFGLTALEILFKTLLGRTQVGITQAVSTERDRNIFFEFVWFDELREEDEYDHADLVSVQMRQYRKTWRVYAINPSNLNRWITSASARGMLAEIREEHNGTIPQEAPMLPLALLAGVMRLPLREEAMQDEVERLLLPAMQGRGFGAVALGSSRRLWRDFQKKQKLNGFDPKVWAASAEFILSEQAHVEITQAAVGKLYGVPLTKMLGPIKQIKTTLKIDGVDERYTPIKNVQIVAGR